MTFVQYVLRRNFCIEVLHEKDVEALKALKSGGGLITHHVMAPTYLAVEPVGKDGSEMY